jgi:preprotein translocase subunit SecA
VDDAKGFGEWCHKSFGFELPEDAVAEAVDREGSCEKIVEAVRSRYLQRREDFGDELAGRIEQYLLLNAIDSKWKDHLHAIDSLKAGIGLRGYGQQDPKIAYKKEGTLLFEEKLLPSIEDEISSLILRIQVEKPGEGSEGGEGSGARVPAPRRGPSGSAAASASLTPRGMTSGQIAAGRSAPTPEQVEAYRKEMRTRQARQLMRPGVAASNAFDVMRRRQQGAAAATAPAGSQPAPASPAAPAGAGRSSSGASTEAQAEAGQAAEAPTVGRNEPCPCGSGKKYKKCHGKA